MRGTLEERFHAKYIPEPNSGCWLWTAGSGNRGYGAIKDHGKMLGAHRVSWEFRYGPIPDGLFVLHKCDIPTCVNPGHLFLGTHQDNASDRVAKGRQARGESSGRSKLTVEQVIEIRAAPGLLREIASRFGVSKNQISMIKKGKNWKHI